MTNARSSLAGSGGEAVDTFAMPNGLAVVEISTAIFVSASNERLLNARERMKELFHNCLQKRFP